MLVKNRIHILLLLLISISINTHAQLRKEKNQPYADQKMYHLGFCLGVHGQDMNLIHTGNHELYAEIPSYGVGFSVGIIGDRYISEYFNLRLIPTLHFGEKDFVFKDQINGIEYKTSVKGNYLSLPLQVKINAGRIDNYRPYITVGGYAAMNVSNEKDTMIRLKKMDYGLEFGLGCNFYLPLFKLCPELKFSLGLVDIINKDRSDLTDKDMLIFTESLSSGKNRMISLIFNFE